MLYIAFSLRGTYMCSEAIYTAAFYVRYKFSSLVALVRRLQISCT